MDTFDLSSNQKWKLVNNLFQLAQNCAQPVFPLLIHFSGCENKRANYAVQTKTIYYSAQPIFPLRIHFSGCSNKIANYAAQTKIIYPSTFMRRCSKHSNFNFIVSTCAVFVMQNKVNNEGQNICNDMFSIEMVRNVLTSECFLPSIARIGRKIRSLHDKRTTDHCRRSPPNTNRSPVLVEKEFFITT